MSQYQQYQNTQTSFQRWRYNTKRAVAFWLRIQWARTGYRPTMRLLHRLNLHYATRDPYRMPGRIGHLCRCHWCGLVGEVTTLDDMRRAKPSGNGRIGYESCERRCAYDTHCGCGWGDVRKIADEKGSVTTRGNGTSLLASASPAF